MANIFQIIKRKREMKGKGFEERERLKRYYRREDAVMKAIRKQKEEKRREEKLAKIKYQASLAEERAREAEANTRTRAMRQANRPFSPQVYGSKGRLERRHPARISRRTPRLR